jgi:AraC-like DNA-binding protein
LHLLGNVADTGRKHRAPKMDDVGVSKVARTPDEWAAAVERCFVPLQVKRIADGFEGTIKERHFNAGTRVSLVDSGASTLERTAKLTADPHEARLLFVCHLSGRANVTQMGRQSVQEPGQAVFYLTADPYELSFPTHISELIFSLPVRAIRMPEGDLRDMASRSIDPSPSLKVLHTCLNELSESRESTESDGLERIAVELVHGVLSRHLGRPAPLGTAALAATIVEFAREHATDPDLSPEALAARFHISRRTLYLALEQRNTAPADLLRRLRIEHATGLLRCTTYPLATVAARSGFSNERTFSRAFAAVQGMSPGAYRERGRTDRAIVV